jgi:hypothetical protein
MDKTITRVEIGLSEDGEEKKLTLYGTTHINHKKWWNALSKELSDYDYVLCEGLLEKDDEYAKPVKKNFKSNTGIYEELAKILNYKTQTWFYNKCGKKNWLNIDKKLSFTEKVFSFFLERFLFILKILLKVRPSLRESFKQSIINYNNTDITNLPRRKVWIGKMVGDKREQLVLDEAVSRIRMEGVHSVAILYGKEHIQGIISYMKEVFNER